MEFDCFEDIRRGLCATYHEVTEGRMMHSPAIHYNGKVFAFFSRKLKMVVKLGKEFSLETLEVEVQEFNPFTTKGALSGWYEVDFLHKDIWPAVADLAFHLAKNQNS